MRRLLLVMLLGALAVPGWAQSRKVLVVMSGQHQLTLKEGQSHPTGFYLNELLVPLKMLMDQGYQPVFATPGGQPAQLDPHSDSPEAFGGDETRYRQMKAFLADLKDLSQPRALEEVAREGLGPYVAVFVPGGHAPMQDLRCDPSLGSLLREAHRRALPTAMICHGPIALLSALSDPELFEADMARGTTPRPQEWPYRDYRMTIFSTAEEEVAEKGFLGGRVLFYPDAALRTAGGQVSAAPAPFESHVVVDRELITGQNPASDKALGEALLKALLPR